MAQGIEHIIAPEHGMIRPGIVVICGDSHTTTYGALGFGIGTSEVEHVLATQTLVYHLAQDMHIRIDGKLPDLNDHQSDRRSGSACFGG